VASAFPLKDGSESRANATDEVASNATRNHA
jgi:hypothetical protein